MGVRLSAEDICGVVGIIPTPAREGAGRWDAEGTVDVEETARMVEGLVSAGVDVIMTNGTFGEGASLLWEEVQEFVDTVVQVVRGRVPVFAGATTLNTRETIRRGKALAAMGVDGLFVGRPMWVALDDRGIVQYYRDVAEALPEMALVIYDNPGAFKGKISPAAYRELSRIPQIVASKHIGLLGGDAFLADLRAVEGRIRLLPLESDWYYWARLFPEQVRACWSGNVACGPAPVVALKEAILGGDWERARRVTEEIEWALEPLFPGGNFQEFLKYSIQLDNAQFEAAGYIRPGPTRAPYTWAPEGYIEGARESGRRWAQLQKRYAQASA